MAKKRYDVCVGQKDKNDKTHWKQIGVVIQTEKGFSLKLESVPVAWDGWAQLFEPKAKESAAPTAPAAAGAGRFDDMTDDVPF